MTFAAPEQINRISGKALTASWVLAIALACASCGSNGGNASPTSNPVAPTVPPAGGERYVTVAFWNSPTCDGAPVSTNRFPVHYGDTQCYTWPGRSGENSASRFSC